MRRVVFDIETSNFFEDVGKNDPSLLDLALLVIHDSETDSYSTYLQEDLAKLWPIIESADVLIGFNSDHFDIPLLNKYYTGDLTQARSLDLMKEVQKSLGRRLALNNLAQATLGASKSADGILAVKWWREGKIDKVAEYCKEDVRLTKELYEHALKHGKWKYREGPDMKEVEIDTSEWKNGNSSSMTHTLGF